LATTKGHGAGGEGGGGSGAGGDGGGRDRRDRPQLRTSHGGGAKRARGDAPRRGRAPAGGASAGPRVRKAKPSARTPAAPSESTSVASDEARALATTIAIAALEKKALGLEILDVAGKVDYADFLVIMTGRSDRQVQALAQGIEEALRKKNRRALAIEGLPHASWVLMDYGDVVVHVFQDEARSLYDIEGLWMDARRLPVPAPDDVT